MRSIRTNRPTSHVAAKREPERERSNSLMDMTCRVKDKIRTTSGVRGDLEPIVKAGAHRAGLVDLIARAVIERPEKPAADMMRSRDTEPKECRHAATDRRKSRRAIGQR